MAKSEKAAKQILVVNDTEEIIELFREIVEGLGHRMVATTYAPEDLEEVRKAEPDLVIVDLLVGGEGAGWQLVQKMRMSPDLAAIPIVICTAATDQVREQEGWLTAQAIKIVFKPFGVEDLERAIEKALALPAMVPGSRTGSGDDRPSREA